MTQYNADFVAELKAGVPSFERSWDGERKAWWIDDLAKEYVKHLCLKYGHVRESADVPDDERVAGEGPQDQKQSTGDRRATNDADYWRRKYEEMRQEAERQRQARERADRQRWDGGSANGSDPYAMLHLTRDAPWEVVRIVYRELVRLHHPDLGGDTERMKAVNVAFERIERERGKK